MEKLQSTARKLDIFFRIVHIFITVALVASLVGMAIIGAYFLFDLSPAMIGTGYGSVELGFLDLEIADSVELSVDVIILGAAAELALGFLCLLTVRHCVQCVRNILAPMTEGTPFNGAASQNLGRLARYTLILGIKLNLMSILGNVITAQAYDLPGLLMNENIVHMTMNYYFDLSFVLIAAVFALLAYVFRYGEELQQLSDETL